MLFQAHGAQRAEHGLPVDAAMAGSLLRLVRIVACGAMGITLGIGLAKAQTAVTISPPNLSGAVAGSLPGSASVSPGGAAIYNVELTIPPGTAGVAPAVSLAYSSQASMGLMGHGWGITGLSSITRCAKTLVQDGNSSAVQLTAEDPFCLDGQRLLKVSGTHGAAAEYRTEIDSFSRIVSAGSDSSIGPDSFRIEIKGGLIYTYGLAADATIEASGRTVRQTWAIHRVEDRRGNYYTYSYSENNATGEYFPVQIRYTGNLVSGLVPYNAIRFVYESRPDPWRGWLVGSPVNHTQRLTAMRMVINTASDGSGGTLAREYRVGYRTNATNGRSLVDSLSDCDSNGQCLPATRFTWTQRDAASNNFNASGSGVWGGPVAVYASTAHKNVWNSIAAVDMNGDGRTDLLKSLENGNWQVCLSTGSAFSCQTWAGPNKKMGDIGMGDYNGDGRTDIAYTDSSTGYVCFSTGAAFSCQAASMSVGPSDTVGDFNADGRDDFGFCYSQGNGNFNCQAINTGQWGVVLEEDAVCPEEIVVRRNITADFNGDGKVDYLVISMWSPACPTGHVHDYAWSLFNSVGGGSQTGFVQGDASGLPRVDQNYGRVFPPGSGLSNFNDDAYPDLVLERLTGSKLSLCQGTGMGFACTSPTVDAAQYDHTIYHVGDFDGDGRSDTVHFGAANQARVCQVGASSYTCSDWSGASGPARMYGDFNGDGKTDLAYYSDATTQWTIGLADGPVPDLLQSVANGVGHVTEFSYSGLNNSAVYTRGADVAYPQRNITAGTTVVSQQRLANALGGWLTTSYAYEGLRTDQQGRGSLGFAAVKATDHASGVTTITRHSQNFPTIGMAQSAQSTSAAGVVLSEATHTLADMATAGGARHPYVQASTGSTRDLNNAAKSTVTMQVNPGGIDAYGNVTNTTTTTVAGGETFSANTVNTYDNLTAPWLIGLLRTSTVTKTATQTGTETTSPVLAFSNCSSITPTTAPTAASLSCTLANTGQTVASAITYAAPSGTTVTGPARCAGTSACGAVTVTTGATSGSYSGSLTATPAPAGTAASTPVALTVNAGVPVLSANPSSLAFGTVRRGTVTASQTVTVSNTGTAATPLNWSISYTSGSISIGLYNTSTATCSSTSALAPGGSCTISVYYQSSCTSGSRNGTLTITGTNAAPVPVTLTATTTTGEC